MGGLAAAFGAPGCPEPQDGVLARQCGAVEGIASTVSAVNLSSSTTVGLAPSPALRQWESSLFRPGLPGFAWDSPRRPYSGCRCRRRPARAPAARGVRRSRACSSCLSSCLGSVRVVEISMSTGPGSAAHDPARRRWFQTARSAPAATTRPKTIPANTKVATVAAAPATPMSSSVSNGAAQAAAPAPYRWRSLREGFTRYSIPGAARSGGTGDRAAVVVDVLSFSALDEVVAACVACRDEALADPLEVGDLLVDLGELGFGAGLQTGSGPVPVTARFEHFGDLVQGEPKALCRLDDPQRGRDLFGIEPVSAQPAAPPSRTSHPPRRPTPASSAGASRPGSGSSTCVTGPRSPPATREAPSTLASTAPSPPTWAG